MSNSVFGALFIATCWVRTLIFYTLLAIWCLFWTTFASLFAPLMSYPNRFRVLMQVFCTVAVWMARIICGIRWEIRGREHLQRDAAVIISNHQSTWETFMIPLLTGPQTQVIKKELLSVPFFGWCFRLLRPIAIDRSNRKMAMQQLTQQGCDYLEQGVWVLIFPEGTRKPFEQPGKFSRGGSMLAAQAQVPVIPLSHNAGKYWPRDSWLRKPGTIVVEIGAPIDSQEKTVSELNKEVQTKVHEYIAP